VLRGVSLRRWKRVALLADLMVEARVERERERERERDGAGESERAMQWTPNCRDGREAYLSYSSV